VTVIALVDETAPTARVAYAINRSVGGAVVRNRLRRRIQAIVRSIDLMPGAYLIAASAAAVALPHDELAGHVRRASTPAR
jgi:ribonuclease P protein component